jgi:hypothetical protein
MHLVRQRQKLTQKEMLTLMQMQKGKYLLTD